MKQCVTIDILTMFLFRAALWSLLLVSSFLGGLPVLASNTLQVAPTVRIESVTPVVEGSLIVYDETQQQYQQTITPHDARVFGVTAMSPALVFSTGVDEVPVVTEGITLVRVSAANGLIKRGDFLVSAPQLGVAMRAGDEHQYVFARALEDSVATADATGLIQAEVGVEWAQAALALERQHAAEAEALPSQQRTATFVRAALAITLVIGALFFILYSFRSTIAEGVVSVGRNPRARGSIITLAVGNIIFALVLCAVVVFIAVAILILPL